MTTFFNDIINFCSSAPAAFWFIWGIPVLLLLAVEWRLHGILKALKKR